MVMMSSDFVIWEGPDIPCINLCKGDKITTVIYKLADLLCKISSGIDLSSIDFSCLVKGEVLPPNTLEKLIQLIIWKLCDLENCCADGSSEISETLVIELPECLQYAEDDELVSQLPIDQYAELLANKLCDIISDINTINVTLDQIVLNISDLQDQIDDLDLTIPNIISKCASNTSPGISTPIDEAVEAIEGVLCDLIDVLGTNEQLAAVKDLQCLDLSNAEQLSNPPNLMKDLAGWTDPPINLAQSLANLWLTVCDMRAKLIDCCVEDEEPCFPYPVDGVTIDDVTLTSGFINWGTPLIPGGELPIEYLVIITEWDGLSKVGLPIVDTVVAYPGTSYECTNADPSKNYIVEVIAVYPCGESVTISSFGQLKLQSLAIEFESDEPYSTGLEDCDGVPSPIAYKKLTLNLVDAISGLPAVNYTASPILITVIYERTICGVITPITLVVPIIPGASFGSVIYQSEYNDYCGDACLATVISLTFCIDSIDNPDVSFLPPLTSC